MNQKNTNNPTHQPSIRSYEAEIHHLKSKNPKTNQTKSEITRLKSELTKHYINNKRFVLEFERTNHEYLALIRSTNNFYKLFGHSAIFYTYSLAPKLNLTAKLQDDKDFTNKSDEGFISIKNIESLTQALATLDIKPVKTKNQTGDFLLYKFPWRFTEEQINGFKEQNLLELQQFNHIVMVDNSIPVLFIEIEELLKAVYENVRGMSSPVERESFGHLAITSATKMAHLYLDLTNGLVNKSDCLKNMKKELKTVKYQTKLLTDLKIWKPRTSSRIGKIIIKIQDIIIRELRREP